ncbi:uncharacterized protein TRIADDRAFT_57604 [Trichoplax adhaerens]|uniref:LisH domain-containing protein ARMC9 n=1 Tax=Trichoplax adhaerens TaxID=10228 RepID=B3RZX0_TRIAD|nr:hypothetical protein TRIADDRAFT_57604 [Trichoplax adhaerens]EDV24286.1 hypothetical protein TRIADDRAFT_57604 [Trichoplax adhaerens]|eukprot:XP_002113812.1 hypothetical protein TRIADDRAFT_57604 [Trichoplax adhaerens]
MKDSSSDTEYVVNEDHLNSVITEYLLFSGLKDTAIRFSEECVNAGKANPNLNQIQTAAEKVKLQSDLISAYKNGDHTEFFSLWNTSLPPETLNADKECQRLEFSLQIYFAIYPRLSPLDSLDASESMARFRKYLDNRGSNFSQSRDLLPYFALPFVPDLRNHEEFKSLFKKNQELIIKRADRNLQASEQRVVKYIKRFNKIQADYHNLIGITAELVDVMEDSIKGKPVTTEYLRTVCNRLFAGSIANQSVDISRPGTASALLRQSVAINESTSILKPVRSSMDGSNEPTVLDFNKIKLDISTESDPAKGFLLQALRWRITKASSIEYRDETMASYSSNDLLGCVESGNYQDTLLELLNEGLLRQSLARFLNAIASLSAGKIRCESKASAVLKVLCDLLGHENREVRPYVNGALYSILSRPTIREEAKAMGLEDMLNYYQSDSNAEERRQMEFILKQLNSENRHDEEDDAASDDEDEEDDDDDQETLEEDIDKDDNIVPDDGDLYGENLLKVRYSVALGVKHKKRERVILLSEIVITSYYQS